MISAPSHPQRLNGNSLFLLLSVLCLASLTGCNLFKKVEGGKVSGDLNDELDPIQGRKVYDPETRSYVWIKAAPTEKMDTVRWKDSDPALSPPIKDSGIAYEPIPGKQSVKIDPSTGSSRLQVYNVVFALPFQIDRFKVQGQIPQNSTWALNFYEGARMAIEMLQKEGASLRVSVLDTKATEVGMQDLAQKNADFKNANLIIGPYRKENVRIAAEAAKNNGAVLVSPYFSGENLVENNPQFVQINPSLQTHCDRILEYALKSFRPDQIVLVARGRDVELERLKIFQDLFKRYKLRNFDRDTSSLRQVLIPDEGDNADIKIDAQPILDGRDTLAVIVPSWSSENFVQTLLRQLDAERGSFETINVFGMPQWMEYERIDFNLFQNLHIHLTSSYFTDGTKWAVKDFQRNYFQRYGQLPARESYLGYDVTLYACRMLLKYGTRFQYATDEKAFPGLHTSFEIEPLPMPGYSGRDFPPVRQFENKYVNLLKFSDFQYILVD
jgi:hypothetical protein